MKKKAIYISAGLIGAAALYFVATAIFKKKPKPTQGEGGEEVPNDEQVKPDPNLSAAIQNGTAKGKKIYTKISDVNIRYSPLVNNGVMDNIWTTIPEKGTYLGTITHVRQSSDTNILNPATNKPYNWIVLNLDQDTWKKYNDQISWYDPDKQNKKWVACDPSVSYCRNNYWVREDTVRF